MSNIVATVQYIGGAFGLLLVKGSNLIQVVTKTIKIDLIQIQVALFLDINSAFHKGSH